MELYNTIAKLVEHNGINFVDTNFVLGDTFSDFDRIADEYNQSNVNPFIIDITLQCMYELEKFANSDCPEHEELRDKASYWLSVFKDSFLKGGKYRLNTHQLGNFFDRAILAEATIQRSDNPVYLFTNDQALTNEFMMLNHSRACKGHYVSVITMKYGTNTHLIKKDDKGYRLIDILYKIATTAQPISYPEFS